MAQSAWMKHLLAFKAQHKGMSLGEAMKKAKHTYKKGGPSKTRKGKQDFVTHKGDADFNKGSKRQHKKRKPYTKKRKSKKSKKGKKGSRK